MNDIKSASKELIDGTKIALDMEIEGYSIYMEAAKRSNNQLGKSTLEAIAQKELLHRKMIEKFYEQLTGKAAERFSFEDSKFWSDKLDREIFQNIKDSLKETVEPDKALIKAYEIAMDMETKGSKFYKKLSDETSDTDAKKLFNFLAKEENFHYEILEDTHLYLSNPSEWFHKEENWVLEG